MPAEAVADITALRAAFLNEPGGAAVRAQAQLQVSAVTLGELACALAADGVDLGLLDASPLSIQPFDQADALRAGRLLASTGLPLADCACLALAARLGLPALTANPGWAALDLGVEVVLIR